jgi:hypothetical protein
MFSLALDSLRAGTDLILEGNFRSGEHDAKLANVIAAAFPMSVSADATPIAHSVQVTQILCRASEPVRIARLKARAADPSRHAGHRDADLAIDLTPPAISFLALPGARFVFDSDGGPAQLRSLLDVIEQQRSAFSHA